MGQQPDQIGISTISQAESTEDTGAPRKTWKRPEVIVGTLAQAEAGSVAHSDGGTGATAHHS